MFPFKNKEMKKIALEFSIALSTDDSIELVKKA